MSEYLEITRYGNRLMFQHPRPSGAGLPFADTPAVAADLLLAKDGPSAVRLAVKVDDGQDADEAKQAAGKEVKRRFADGGTYFK